MKAKVLTYLLDKRDTTSFWRGTPMRHFNNKEFEVIDVSDLKAFDWTVFYGVDIFWMQRPFGMEHAQVLTAAKNMGCKIILEYDDDLTCVDMYNPTHRLYKENQATLKICLSLADEVWVSTQSIGESFVSMTSNIYVIPNSHNDYLFKVGNKKEFDPHGKACYYRGGASHQADVNSMANKILEVVNANPDWTFAFMGDRYYFLEMNTGDNYHIVPGMTIMEYFKYIHQENPQLFIFPLCDTKFNRGKSNISWLEATYVGSAFAGNKVLPEFNNENILEVSDLPELIKNGAEPLKIANERSWEYICDNLLLSKVNKLRENRILANI